MGKLSTAFLSKVYQEGSLYVRTINVLQMTTALFTNLWLGLKQNKDKSP